jgi:inner membrane protein
MDPITHTLTGLALSRAGLKRYSPHATGLLLLAANAPDMDAVTAVGGATTYLHYHRHITHALIAIPFMAALPVLVVWLFSRRKKEFGWKRAYLVCLVGGASHPLLDFMNVYAIRLFLPFSGEWVRADLFHIVELWIWAVLMLAAIAPAISRLVSAEMGAKPSSGRGIAIFALLFVFLYGCGRWVLHQRALAVLESRLYEGGTPRRIAAFPAGPANPFRWTGLVETESFYGLFDVNLLGDFDPSAGHIAYKPAPGPREQAAARAARETYPFQVFLDFSQFPFWRFSPAEPPEEGIRVEVLDLRFGSPSTPGFLVSAVVRPTGEVVDAAFHFRPATR